MTYVGKVMRWSKPTFGGARATVAEYVILWEEGDRMLVYVVKHDSLKWMQHASLFHEEYSGGHTITLEDP